MIRKFKNSTPTIPNSCYIFPNATVIGNVVCGERVIVYPGCVLHAEMETVTIGDYTNIQDNSVVHVDIDISVSIGKNVTIGHGCIIHGCTIKDNALIGMGAIIQNGAVIGENCFIGAGALVKQNMVVPDGYMAYGFPAKVVRPITDEEFKIIRIATAEYQEYLGEFKRQDAENED